MTVAAAPAAAADPTPTAYGWGGNWSGQLGDGTNTNRATPVPVAAPAGVTLTAVSASARHSVGLSSTGVAYAWGDNAQGQLGDGTTITRTTPVPVLAPAGVTFTAVAAAGFTFYHSVGLSTTGKLYAWGANYDGEVGDGTCCNIRTTPVAVAAPAGVTFTAIAVAGKHNLALSTTGVLYAWGWNPHGELGDGTTTTRFAPVPVAVPSGVTFTAIAANWLYSLAVSTTGVAYAWGWNAYGQLGDGTTTNRTTPVQVSAPAGVTFSVVAPGGYHSVALSTTGVAYAWGKNDSGQLGDGTTTNRTTPVPVQAPSGVVFRAVSAGGYHSVGLSTTGVAYAWGENTYSQLGDGTTTNRTTPVPVQAPSGVVFRMVAAGGYHSVAVVSSPALLADPTANGYAWGDNKYGQLGDGTTTNRATPVPVQAPAGVTFSVVADGGFHTLALSTTGVAYAWGTNFRGQVGDGTVIGRTSPVAVATPAGVTFRAVSAGDLHSVGLSTAGVIYAWGYNAQGQLGDGTTTNRATPVPVQAPAGVLFSTVFAAGYHTLALSTTGVAYAWGGNGLGQVGDGTDSNIRTSPVQVQAPAGVTFRALAGGNFHSLGLSSTGAAYEWGWDGAKTPVPVGAPAGVTFTAIDGGGNHSVALSTTGVAYAWGDNTYGELGDGTLTKRSAPVQVLAPAGVIFAAVGAGRDHSVAVSTTGVAYAWGRNVDGQLGDGTIIDRVVPVQVQAPPGVIFRTVSAGASHTVARTLSPPNLASGRVPAVSSILPGRPDYSPAHLTDGVRTSTPSSKGWHTAVRTTATVTESATIDLGARVQVDRVTLYPAAPDGLPIGYGFPVDYTVEISTSPSFAAGTVTTIASVTNSAAPTAARQHDKRVTGQYVRLRATKLRQLGTGAYGVVLAEMEVRASTNLAYSRTPTAASVLPGRTDYTPAMATDGIQGSIPQSKGYHSAVRSTPNVVESLTLDLGAQSYVDVVRLHPASPDGRPLGYGFPVSYTIEVSDVATFATYKTVAQVNGQPQPTTAVHLNVQGVGRYVRLKVTTSRALVTGSYAVVLAEFETEGSPL